MKSGFIDVAISPRERQTIVASNRYRAMKKDRIWRCCMGAVMIKCPDTGCDIATGIVADRESFNATPVFFARVYCPVCRTEHEWFAKEAWVCDAEVPESAERRRLS
jgi:hypothetical protein